ncbi:hypothetical protein [Novosphingobium sp.]|jgi:hypothetical protein
MSLPILFPSRFIAAAQHHQSKSHHALAPLIIEANHLATAAL